MRFGPEILFDLAYNKRRNQNIDIAFNENKGVSQ
jgi:hypothetical protein